MKHSAIKENHLYNKVFRRGDRYIGKLVTVHVLTDFAAKRRMLAHPQRKWTNRVGLSVSKKLGGAVARNRAKRIIRAGWQAVEREGKIRTGYLVVLSARPGITDAKSQDVERELRYALNKLNMLRPAEEQKPS